MTAGPADGAAATGTLSLEWSSPTSCGVSGARSRSDSPRLHRAPKSYNVRYTEVVPKKGERATECKRGHDLTLPGSRLAVSPGHRGGGGCKQCMIDQTRARRGSTKVGPSSPHRGNEIERLDAIARGMKRCPECEQAKELSEFWNDRRTFDGKASYCKQCAGAKKSEDWAKRRKVLGLRQQAKKFGITVETLEQMIANQGDSCAICERPCVTGRALAVDHDHLTGAVRGLLCANCNRAIGLLQDSPRVAASAHAYLVRWKTDGDASLPGAELS